MAHSLRAYFIRRGDHAEPVRYEVDRIRNGRSFCTRRVVARQSVGAILNLEASYQAPEEAADIETVSLAARPAPTRRAGAELVGSGLRALLRPVGPPRSRRPGRRRSSRGLAASQPGAGRRLVCHQGGLAYLSDDLPTDAVVRAHPSGSNPRTVLHHGHVLRQPRPRHLVPPPDARRPVAPVRLHLPDLIGGRGLATGHVFDAGGTHVATVAQEVLLRDVRKR